MCWNQCTFLNYSQTVHSLPSAHGSMRYENPLAYQYVRNLLKKFRGQLTIQWIKMQFYNWCILTNVCSKIFFAWYTTLHDKLIDHLKYFKLPVCMYLTKKCFENFWKGKIYKAPAGFKLITLRFVLNTLINCTKLLGNNLKLQNHALSYWGFKGSTLHYGGVLYNLNISSWQRC